MTDRVNQLASSSMEDALTLEGNPLIGKVNQSTTSLREDPPSPRGNYLVASDPLSIELGTNIMTTTSLILLKSFVPFP